MSPPQCHPESSPPDLGVPLLGQAFPPFFCNLYFCSLYWTMNPGGRVGLMLLVLVPVSVVHEVVPEMLARQVKE